jgi:hypothetical protein
MQSGMRGYKETNVHACIRRCNRKGLKLLMQHGVEINVYNDLLGTALFSAIENYVDHVLKIHDLGTDLNDLIHEDPDDIDDINDEGDETKCRRGIIKDILKYNVDFEYPDKLQGPNNIDIPSPSINSIRDLVDSYRDKQSVDYLRSLEPDEVNVQDEWGKTALHRAVENGQFEAVRVLLVEKFARDNIQDFWGNTAAQALRRRYMLEVSKQQENHYVVDDVTGGHSFRFQGGDAVIAAKLPIFRRIGQYLHDHRLFRDRLGPRMRQSNDESALYYPTFISGQLLRFLFS